MDNITAFLSIPWEDVLFPSVFPLLSYKDLMNMKKSDPRFYDPVNMYIGKMTKIDSTTQSWRATRAMLPRTKSLKSLILPAAMWFNDTQLIGVIKQNPQLKKLRIASADMITLHGLISILRLEGLTHVSLCDIRSVDDTFIRLLGKAHPDLEEVDLIDSKSTDRGLVPLFKSCERLRKIRFTIQNGVTRRTVRALVKYCKNLQAYELSIDHDTPLNVIRDVMRAFNELLHRK